MHYEVSWDGCIVSTDPARLDLGVIHGFLRDCYWSAGISYGQVQRQCANSLCFGLYREQAQIGFARVVSDFTRFAYLADVFVHPRHQGRGLGLKLMEAVLDHPELRDVVLWTLATKDAHSFYQHCQFKQLRDSTAWMERIGKSPRRWV